MAVRLVVSTILILMTGSAVSMIVNIPQDDDLFTKRQSCQDKIGEQKCAQISGYCKLEHYSSWMKENCKKTCNDCPKLPTKPSVHCTTEISKYCSFWEMKGYCKPESPYYEYVTKRCPITCGLCAEPKPTQPRPPRDGSVNIQECLKAHNDYRAHHGAPPLKWDSQKASEAQKYADFLAQKGIFKHADGIKDGENLAYQWSMTGYTCKQATDAWYSEVKDYQYSNPGYSDKTGHFTQVVWKSTRLLGVGIAKKGHVTYVVARYFPPGNMLGAFSKNVGQPVDN